MNPELFNSEAWIRIQFRLNQRNSDSIQFNSRFRCCYTNMLFYGSLSLS